MKLRDRTELLVSLAARLTLLALAAVLAGCQTVPRMAPADLSQPGWTVRHGQAVWRPPRMDREIAGELLLATHPSGQSVVQFTKTPIPIVAARTTTSAWEIEFIPENRRFSGRGNPPARFIWLHLAPVLEGKVAPKNISMTGDAANWRVENRRTGERLEGFLTP